ncbi:hypothetical protein ACF0H5_021460 [Mactra antiquata]
MVDIMSACIVYITLHAFKTFKMANPSVLKALTREQIEEALKKVRQEVDVPGVKIEIVTEEYYDKALVFMRDNFVLKEPMAVSVGLQWTPELEQIWIRCFKFNISLMFVDEKTGEIIAMRTSKISRKGESVDPSTIKEQPLRDVFDIFTHCERNADFFGKFGTTEAFHFYGLAVSEKYGRQGYGEKICRAAISMFRHLGFDPFYIRGEATSNYSKRIYEKVGLQEIFEQRYDTWIVDGRRPIQNTGIHESMKLYGMKLTQNDRAEK